MQQVFSHSNSKYAVMDVASSVSCSVTRWQDSKAGGVSSQQRWVHHTPLQGHVQGEVIGRSLHAVARESPATVRDGQLRVMGRQWSREEVGVEQCLQGGSTEVKKGSWCVKVLVEGQHIYLNFIITHKLSCWR